MSAIQRFGNKLDDYLTQFIVDDKNVSLCLFCIVDIIRCDTKQYNHDNPVFIMLQNEVSNMYKYCKKHPNKIFKLEKMIKYVDLITKKIYDSPYYFKSMDMYNYLFIH